MAEEFQCSEEFAALTEELVTAATEFVTDATKFADKGTAACAHRARRALGVLRKSTTKYRKMTIEMVKDKRSSKVEEKPAEKKADPKKEEKKGKK